MDIFLITLGVLVLLVAFVCFAVSIIFQVSQFQRLEEDYKTPSRFIKDVGLMTVGLGIVFIPAIIGGILSWYQNRKMYKIAEANLKFYMSRDLILAGEWVLAPQRQRLGISHGFIFYSIEHRLKGTRWRMTE